MQKKMKMKKMMMNKKKILIKKLIIRKLILKKSENNNSLRFKRKLQLVILMLKIENHRFLWVQN